MKKFYHKQGALTGHIHRGKKWGTNFVHMVSKTILSTPVYIIGFFFLWLTLLSIYTFKIIGHYRNLTKGTTKKNLQELMEIIIDRQEQNAKNLSYIAKEMDIFRESQKRFLTKYALIRFNPFEDVGGDQSFAFALLDGTNNGIVVSSLHSRGGTKIYAKPVVGAKSKDYGFSKEEKEVVEKAAQYAPSSVY